MAKKPSPKRPKKNPSSIENEQHDFAEHTYFSMHATNIDAFEKLCEKNDCKTLRLQNAAAVAMNVYRVSGKSTSLKRLRNAIILNIGSTARELKPGIISWLS